MFAEGDAGQSWTLDELNNRYGIGEAVRFVAGPGDLPVASLHCDGATASVALLGATVTEFWPRGAAPVLFVSRLSHHTLGLPIRGGIPVCWPWFGPHPTNPDLPGHGFVRTRLWSVEETGTAGSGETELSLRLDQDDRTLALWPYPFTVRLTVRLGQTLHVALEATHPGGSPGTPGGGPVSCTGALHTYLAVGDAGRIAIAGLEDTSYVDKVEGGALRQQQGRLTIAGETDRVYVDTAAPVTVDDPVLGRRLSVTKWGSRTTVVWNPWEARARAMPDFGEDEYRHMVCVETANALQDAVTLAPGATHRLETRIGID